MPGTPETVETAAVDGPFPSNCEAFFSNTPGFYSVKMESDSEDLITLNPSNVGPLHTDYPMDASADRFRRNIHKQVKDLKESTDQLVGALSRFEESRDEADWQVVESARMEVQGVRTHLVKMRGEAMNGEGDVVMESANEELARVDRVVALVTDGSLGLRI
jgi:hypothetical protein